MSTALDVRSYGPWVNGVNCTATLKAAIAAAGAAGGPAAVYLPAVSPFGGVGVLLTPVGQTIGAGTPIIPTGAIVVPDQVSLWGDGFGSIVACDMSLVTNSFLNWQLIFHGSNCVFSNFSINGNNAATPGGLTGQQMIMVHPSRFDGSVGFNTYDKMYVTGVAVPAGAFESFGIMTAWGQHDVLFIGCRGISNQGTPFHIAGGNTVGTTNLFSSNVRLIQCEASANTWQGFSDYAANDVQYINCKSSGNTISGFNSEYSFNLQYSGCLSSGNAHGLSVLGGCQNIRWEGGAIFNNSTDEINLNASAYYTGAPSNAPYQGFELRNARLTPATGKPHIRVISRSAPAGTNSGAFFSSAGAPYTNAIPQASPGPLLIDCPDGDDFVLWDTAAAGPVPAPTGVRYSIRKATRPVLVGKLNSASWTVAGVGMTITSGVSGAVAGGVGKNQAFLTNTNAGVGTLTTATFLLLATKRYLVRWRTNVVDVNATWQIQFKEQTSGTVIQSQIFSSLVSNDRAVWYESAAIINTGTTNPCQIIFSPTGTPSATAILNIDYVTVEEVELGGNLSEV